MDFDQTDLNETVDAIRTRLSNGESVVGLLEEIVALVRDREAFWQTQFDELVAAQAETATENADIMKGLIVAIKGVKRVGSRQRMLEKSVAGLTTMGKSLTTTAATTLAKSVVDTPITTAESLEQTAKKGLLANAVLRMFGPNGGRPMKYNKSLAARLRVEGKLSEKQHNDWKRFGRMPDDVAV